MSKENETKEKKDNDKEGEVGVCTEKVKSYSRPDKYKVFYFKDSDNFTLISIHYLGNIISNSFNNSICLCN